MPSEFQLIEQFFTRHSPRADVLLGVGDDGAVLRPSPDHDLVQTMDTMVEGVHFFPAMAPLDLGHKLMAVNLSDLAAMGAEPAWGLLSITLPEADTDWLEAFGRGLFELADRYHLALVGGDTCRGPRSVTLQLTGLVPRGRYLTRAGAAPGDLLYVSGDLGGAGLALSHLTGGCQLTAEQLQPVMQKLVRPTPRVELGLSLRELASAAIDISDGLAADLGHLLRSSGVGAVVDLALLPMHQVVREQVQGLRDWSLPLCAGDDYELCFTLPAEREAQLRTVLRDADCPVTRIGRIVTGGGVEWLGLSPGWKLESGGFDHFVRLG